MKIAYLGPKGSFSHHVVQTAFPQEELQAFANITDVIKAYEQGLWTILWCQLKIL